MPNKRKPRQFKLAKHLTFATVAADKLQFIALLQSNKQDVICCDLSTVKTCDSAGLALLIDIRRLCRQERTPLSMENIPEAIRALAILYGVEQIFYEC